MGKIGKLPKHLAEQSDVFWSRLFEDMREEPEFYAEAYVESLSQEQLRSLFEELID